MQKWRIAGNPDQGLLQCWLGNPASKQDSTPSLTWPAAEVKRRPSSPEERPRCAPASTSRRITWVFLIISLILLLNDNLWCQPQDDRFAQPPSKACGLKSPLHAHLHLRAIFANLYLRFIQVSLWKRRKRAIHILNLFPGATAPSLSDHLLRRHGGGFDRCDPLRFFSIFWVWTSIDVFLYGFLWYDL